MSAIPATERPEHQRATRRLVASATEIQESPDGLSFRLSPRDFDAAVEFVARERLCCPFLHFAIEVSPGDGPLWLRVKGPRGAGAFLRFELQLPE